MSISSAADYSNRRRMRGKIGPVRNRGIMMPFSIRREFAGAADDLQFLVGQLPAPFPTTADIRELFVLLGSNATCPGRLYCSTFQCAFRRQSWKPVSYCSCFPDGNRPTGYSGNRTISAHGTGDASGYALIQLVYRSLLFRLIHTPAGVHKRLDECFLFRIC